MGKGTEMAVPILWVTQQWCPASLAAQASSMNVPNCGAPYSHPCGLSLHSQQLSPPCVHYPNPTFQHPALLHIHRHTAQAGACRAAERNIRVGLNLSYLSQTSSVLSFRLLSRSSSSVPAHLPNGEGASLSAGTASLLQLPARGAGTILFLFFFFTFLSPT